MMNYQVKRATITDIDNGLLDLYIDGYMLHHSNRPDIFPKKSNSELKEMFLNELNNGIHNFLMIVKDDNILGLVSYHLKEKNDIKSLWIDELVINKKYRGQGYGTILINEMKEIGAINKCHRIDLNCWSFNEDALAFYKKLHFNNQRVILEYNLSNIGEELNRE